MKSWTGGRIGYQVLQLSNEAGLGNAPSAGTCSCKTSIRYLGSLYPRLSMVIGWS